jgi:hypothetical protein
MAGVFPASMDQLADLLDEATTAFAVFGHDIQGRYCRMAKLCHPDLFSAGLQQDKAAKVFRRLTVLRDAAMRAAHRHVVVSPKREYGLVTQLATGDLTDVYQAVAEGVRYVVKIARHESGNPLLATEARHLELLMTRSGGHRYREYLPHLIETFALSDAEGKRQANVSRHREGFYTLESVRRRHVSGLDPRHLAWIFKRMLEGIGFVQTCGLVHGAILPPHVSLHAENHGLQFLDWIHSVRTGNVVAFVPTAYRHWYPGEVLRRESTGPATDIFLAARCLIYAAGGDFVAGRWPASVPREMQRFVDTCLFASPRMRPQDAWKLHEEFDELLLRLFGPPKYHHLVMS